MGTFDDEGNYTPREIVFDDLGMSFADAIDGTLVSVEDGAGIQLRSNRPLPVIASRVSALTTSVIAASAI